MNTLQSISDYICFSNGVSEGWIEYAIFQCCVSMALSLDGDDWFSFDVSFFTIIQKVQYLETVLC